MTGPLSYFGCNEISVSLVISPRGNFIDDVCKRGTNNTVGKPGSRYSTLLIRDDVEDEIRKPNNVVCRDHEMQIILGKSYCTDLLARKNSNHLSHTLTTSQKTFTAQ